MEHIPISKDSAGNIMNGNTSNNRRFIAKSYPLVNVYIAIENGDLVREFTH